MNKYTLLKRVKLEELEIDNRELAELIGLEIFLRLVAYYGGTYIYVPKAETLTMGKRNEVIREEYNGCNVSRLALKYDLSVSRISDIIAEKREELRRRPIKGQTSLFVD